MIVPAASGMATGGRVVHHLKAFAPDERNTILFAGFQAAADALRRRIEETKRWRCTVPDYRETFELE